MEKVLLLDDGIEWNLSKGICINIKKSILVPTQLRIKRILVPQDGQDFSYH